MSIETSKTEKRKKTEKKTEQNVKELWDHSISKNLWEYQKERNKKKEQHKHVK